MMFDYAGYVATDPIINSTGGDTRIVVKWVKVCICGTDALDDPALEDVESHLCSSCWLHLHGQLFADAMYETRGLP